MRKTRDTARGFILGVLVTVLIAAAPTAAATVGKKAIEIVYSDIRLVVDGKVVTPVDANGKVVEPFSYEGTTYLPVRAAVNAITGGSKTVDWDQDTHTIYIGGKPAADSVDASTLKDYSSSRPCFYNRETSSSGYTFEVRQKTYTPFNWLASSHATFLLNGDYTAFNCSIAVKDRSSEVHTYTVTFMNPDTNEVIKSVTVKPGEAPIEVSVDVAGLDKLWINAPTTTVGIVVYNATLTTLPNA